MLVYCMGGSKARRARAVARTSAQIFCKFCMYINTYKLDNLFRFYDYLLAISYVNTYKYVVIFFFSLRLYNKPGSATHINTSFVCLVGLQCPSVRRDGWLKIEMGEFNLCLEDEEVHISFIEGNFFLEGIEV